MRIVGGTARGRTLAAPKSDDVIRPTADRVRETLFNILGQTCDDLDVLDLYAGTGALGLEAVSRGANKAVLVDSGREALALCKENIEALKFGAKVELLVMDAIKAIASLGKQGRTFQLVFADPPYNKRAGLSILEALDAANVITDGGIAVIETGADEKLPEQQGRFTRIDERAYGATNVSIFRLTHHAA